MTKRNSAEQVLSSTVVYPGDVVRLLIAVTDPADGTTAMDPATLKVKVLGPSDVAATTYTYGVGTEIVRSALGSYYINIKPTVARHWYVQVATTTPDDVDEYWFAVAGSAF